MYLHILKVKFQIDTIAFRILCWTFQLWYSIVLLEFRVKKKPQKTLCFPLIIQLLYTPPWLLYFRLKSTQ